MAMESPGFSAACLSHVGLVRTHNEDALVLAGLMVFGTSMHAPVECVLRPGASWVIAVADGMGGANAGEVASQKAVEALAGMATVSTASVAELLKRLNDQFYDIGKQDPALVGMGSAVAGLCCGDDGIFAFNVGDCRVYRQQGEFLAAVTADDTVAQILADSGKTDTSEIRDSNLHVLTQSLGGRLERAPIDPHIYPLRVQGSARFLICSDGLTDMLGQDEIERIVCPCPNAEDAVTALRDAVFVAGGRDNLSLVLVSVVRETPTTRLQDEL